MSRKISDLVRLLPLLAALGFVAWTPAAEAQQRELFSGAALIYTVPELTIIYPAGEGVDAERNRISALRKVAYLEGRHDTRAQILSDVEALADESKLQGNILVLGWNNQLIKETGIIEWGEEGWDFLGIQRSADHDLLFYWVSPYNTTQHFFFWSRIDPELDRFLVLPFFGSDWIVYDGYSVNEYGRFLKNELVWPPKRNGEVEIDRRETHPKPRRTESSKYFDLHPYSNLTDAAIERVLAARDEAWSTAYNALGIEPPSEAPRVKLYVYDDSTHKEEQGSVHDPRHHMPQRQELHLTKNLAANSAPHEDAHLVARREFGPAYLTAFAEGLAVWIESKEADDLAQFATTLIEQDQLPTVAELLDEERLRNLIRQRIGFSAAGLFVEWLYETLPADRFRSAYGSYSSEMKQLGAVIKMKPAKIEKEYRSWVERRAREGRSAAERAEQIAEALHFGRIGDFGRTVEVLNRLLESRPNDPELLYTLAFSQSSQGDGAAAETTLGRLLSLASGLEPTRHTVYGWFLKGQLREEAGDVAGARSAYQQIIDADSVPGLAAMRARAQQAMKELETD